MISEQDAERFADEWIKAWNDHDIDAIMDHYDDDVEYYSPIITLITGDASGMLRGTAAVRDYLAAGLERNPSLHFKLLRVFRGIGSVTLYYISVGHRLAAEVFELTPGGRATRVLCHYDELSS